MRRYVALLRGINVGGKNLIKMSELRACLEALGFRDVRTYIQSGNVIFSANKMDKDRLTKQVEKALSKTFGYDSRVVVRSREEMEKIIAGAPKGFGGAPDTYRYDVIFLKDPVTAAEAMKSVRTKEGVDQASAGKGVLYFARLSSKATQSHLPRLVSMPVYQSMTIRNWNTTVKLLELMRTADKHR